MSADPGHVQVQPDSTGKKVDATSFTRPDGTVSPPTIYRQILVIGDAEEDALLAEVVQTSRGKALRVVDQEARELLERLVIAMEALATGLQGLRSVREQNPTGGLNHAQ